MKNTRKTVQKYTDATIREAAVALVEKANINNDFLADIIKKEEDKWTPRMRAAARRCMVAKYGDELRDQGYDPDRLPKPKIVQEARSVDFDIKAKKFLVAFPYNWGTLQCLKDCIDRKDMTFDKERKYWVIPEKFSRAVASFLSACRDVQGQEFLLSDTAEARIGKIAA